jgi:pilus assembly protein CpaE
MVGQAHMKERHNAIEGPRPVKRQMQGTASVVLICPNEAHRTMLVRALEGQHANVLSELTLYPAYNHLMTILDVDCDAFIVDVDTDLEVGLDLVEAICTRKPYSTVMVYSTSHSPDLLVRSMRTGAREFLSGVVMPSALSDALLRAAARRADQDTQKALGKVLLFWGAKGGSGVSTLASNFAVALQEEVGGEVALVDLNPQLGDISVLLGVKPEFTIAEALLDPSRLDEEFVSLLATRHTSGLSVIAAPDAYNASIPVDERSIRRLLDLVRKQYPFVVVDAGFGLGQVIEPLFQAANSIYLVTQADIPSLRNTQRFLAYLQQQGELRVELVLNRYEARRTEFDDGQMNKALGMAPKWKVPNDYAAVHRATNVGTTVLAERTSIASVIRQMARAAAGKVTAELPAKNKKKGFGIFG